MSLVFISHANNDKKRLLPYLEQLLASTDSTISLWIDRPEEITHEYGQHPRIKPIRSGQDWWDEIKQGLLRADCIIAFWSLAAVQGNRDVFLREIDMGRKLRKCIQLSLDSLNAVNVPAPFKFDQIYDISDMTDPVCTTRFKRAVGEIGAHVRRRNRVDGPDQINYLAQKLADAMSRAFNAHELNLILRDVANEELNDITRGDDLFEQTWDMIDWAVDNGWLVDIAQVAVIRAPDDPLLPGVVDEVKLALKRTADSQLNLRDISYRVDRQKPSNQFVDGCSLETPQLHRRPKLVFYQGLRRDMPDRFATYLKKEIIPYTLQGRQSFMAENIFLSGQAFGSAENRWNLHVDAQLKPLYPSKSTGKSRYSSALRFLPWFKSKEEDVFSTRVMAAREALSGGGQDVPRIFFCPIIEKELESADLEVLDRFIRFWAQVSEKGLESDQKVIVIIWCELLERQRDTTLRTFLNEIQILADCQKSMTPEPALASISRETSAMALSSLHLIRLDPLDLFSSNEIDRWLDRNILKDLPNLSERERHSMMAAIGDIVLSLSENNERPYSDSLDMSEFEDKVLPEIEHQLQKANRK